MERYNYKDQENYWKRFTQNQDLLPKVVESEMSGPVAKPVTYWKDAESYSAIFQKDV